MTPKPIVCKGRGGAANRLFQFLFCAELARRAGNAFVANAHIPDLGLSSPQWHGDQKNFLNIEGSHQFDLQALAREISDGPHPGATFSGYALRAEYYELDFCRSLLRDIGSGQGFGSDFLAIHIRAGDIFFGGHPDYRPLPICYYENLVRKTQLQPAFVGQTHTNKKYGAALRKRFPNAIFLGSRTPRDDFLTLLGSTHVALAISSFSWLAAWLSPVATSIHVPVAGFLDPRQRPDINLLPPDTRFVLHPLPKVDWQGTRPQVAELFA